MADAKIWTVYYLSPTEETVFGPHETTTQVLRPQGYVWNNILWDGVSEWSPPEGSAVIEDDARNYPIGATYSSSAAPTNGSTAG